MKKIFSKALFIENIKRFWGISAASALGYYLMGIEFIRMDVRTGVSRTLVYNMLTNNWIWLFVLAVTPIIAAAAVFEYIDSAKATNAIYSMPYSRRSLFVTNYLSGMTISMIPIITTALMLIIFKCPTVPDGAQASWSIVDSSAEVYTIAGILKWLLQSFMLTMFTFSFAVFGFIISGNIVIGTLTAICANGIIPILAICGLLYAEDNLYGFRISDFTNYSWTSPFIRLFFTIDNYGNSYQGIFEQLVYIIIALIIAFAAYLLYEKRKNERVTDAYVFEAMETIIGFIFVLIPCTLAGLVFYEPWGKMSYLYGGLIGYVLGQMITRKRLNILDKKSAKNAVMFAIIMVLIIAGFDCDIFGYERFVPKDSRIEKVEVECTYSMEDYNIDNADEVFIANVTSMHRAILENRGNDNGGRRVIIKYTLKSGRVVEREYFVSDEFLSSNEFSRTVIETIYGVDSDVFSILSLNPEKLTGSIDFTIAVYEESQEYEAVSIDFQTLSVNDKQRVFSALVEDINKRDIFSNVSDVVGNIYLTLKEENVANPDELDELIEKYSKVAGYNMCFKDEQAGKTSIIFTFNYKIYSCDLNTRDWLNILFEKYLGIYEYKYEKL